MLSLLCLGGMPFVLQRFPLVVNGIGHRRMFEAVEQIAGQRAVEEEGVGRGIGDPLTGNRFRQVQEIAPVDGDAAGVRPDHAAERFGEGFRAAAVRPDDRHRLVRLDLDGDVIDEAGAAVVGERQIGDDERARQRPDRGNREFLDTAVD